MGSRKVRWGELDFGSWPDPSFRRRLKNGSKGAHGAHTFAVSDPLAIGLIGGPSGTTLCKGQGCELQANGVPKATQPLCSLRACYGQCGGRFKGAQCSHMWRVVQPPVYEVDSCVRQHDSVRSSCDVMYLTTAEMKASGMWQPRIERRPKVATSISCKRNYCEPPLLLRAPVCQFSLAFLLTLLLLHLKPFRVTPKSLWGRCEHGSTARRVTYVSSLVYRLV